MSSAILIELIIQTPKLKRVFEQALESFADASIKRSKAQGVPHVIVLELDSAIPSQGFEQLRALMRASPLTEVFVTADAMESSILLELLRAGVREFLPQPLTRQNVEQALNRCKERSREASAQRSQAGSKVISIIGGKGGVGTTFVSVNLAGFLQKLEDEKTVVLVDLNFQDPDLPLFLDIEPVHSFQDINENLERLDGTYLMNVLTRHGTGLYVLPLGHQESLSSKVPVSTECIQKTLELLQAHFDYVLVDCGHVLDVSRRSVLALSSTVVLVSTLHVPVIRSTKDVLDLLREAGHASEKVKLVMNRFEPSEDSLLKNTEGALNHTVSTLIPHNSRTASRAINNGQLLTVMDGQSDISQSLQRLAESFAESRKPATNGSFLGTYIKAVKAKLVRDHVAPARPLKNPIFQDEAR